MKHRLLILALATALPAQVLGQEAKELDSDVIYEEARLPRYDLPPLLTTAEGKLVSTAWPLGELFDRGYAFVAVYQQDLVRHNEVSFDRGIAPLFYRTGQSFPKAHEWGVLAAVAWGAMRAPPSGAGSPGRPSRRW